MPGLNEGFRGGGGGTRRGYFADYVCKEKFEGNGRRGEGVACVDVIICRKERCVGYGRRGGERFDQLTDQITSDPHSMI